MKMIKKLRLRFVIITMIIVTVMLFVIFGLVLTLTHNRIYSDSVKMMEGVAGIPIGMNRNRRPVRHGMNDGTDVQLPFFRVEVDAEGNIVASDGDFYDLTDEETVDSLVGEVLSGKKSLGDLSDYNLRYLCTISPPERGEDKAQGSEGPKTGDTIPGTEEPKISEGVPEGEVPVSDDKDQAPDTPEFEPGKNRDGNSNKIIVFTDISSEVSTMRNLIRNCFFIGLLSFIVFLVIAMFFASWAVKPVEDAWIRQRQFISDASHELKTPLSVILTDAEMLKSRELDENKKKQFADNILTMSHQMRGLVESLLQLARVDNGAIQKAPEQLIDFSRMVSNEIMTFEVIFFEKGLLLTEDVEEGISIKGAPQYIKQVIEILLDNAQKYSFPKGTVEVALKKSGSHRCLLSVSDPGEQISDEDLKNIFKRFYRIDEARAMNHSYGLGLSIAENIVKDHKGRIWAESKNGINTFKVELPLV